MYCMSYALMLFEELFASQLSVPSSPEHPTKCMYHRLDENWWREDLNDYVRKSARERYNNDILRAREKEC